MLHDTYPVFFNFWRPSRYCSSSNHYVLRDSQQFRLISEGVASVPAVYQFLSVEQKSKVIFVPRALYSKLSHIKCDLKFFPSLQRHSIMKRRE